MALCFAGHHRWTSPYLLPDVLRRAVVVTDLDPHSVPKSDDDDDDDGCWLERPNDKNLCIGTIAANANKQFSSQRKVFVLELLVFLLLFFFFSGVFQDWENDLDHRGLKVTGWHFGLAPTTFYCTIWWLMTLFLRFFGVWSFIAFRALFMLFMITFIWTEGLTRKINKLTIFSLNYVFMGLWKFQAAFHCGTVDGNYDNWG